MSPEATFFGLVPIDCCVMTSISTVAGANCVACHSVLDASWSFCPFCGSDNRDPALHQGPVGNHTHDFRFGAHCVLCGAAGGGQPVLPQNPTSQQRPLPPSSLGTGSGSIVLSDNLILRVFGVMFIAVALFTFAVIVYFAVSSPKRTDGPPVAWAVVFMLVFAIAGVGALFAERQTIFDLQARTITLRRGSSFAPKVETYSFDDVTCLKLEKYTFSGEDGASFNQNCILSLVRGTSGVTLLKTYTYLGRGRRACEELSRSTGIPLDDRTL